MPLGALTLKTSRVKHAARNKSTTSNKCQRTQTPSPQTTARSQHSSTNAAPPPPQTTTTSQPNPTIAVSALPHTTEATPSTVEGCIFVPTLGSIQHDFLSPSIRHAMVGEEEGDETVRDAEEEESEQKISSGQRPLITIVGHGLHPSDIRSHERDGYFDMFKSLVWWGPRDDARMKDEFHKQCGIRIKDIFYKMRNAIKKLDRMGEDVWKYFHEGWQLEEFKQVSKQNKKNQASTKGRAVHTSRRKAHHDVALDLEKKLSRPPNSDELFIVTHKKKDRKWVDRRSEKTHGMAGFLLELENWS
ncbi:unnamed protein product [Vicia faba]|uniref:Uncharacterized protein n=1 Tax=Vicia faba TaxID=3906 RepID=A0AAV0ZC25_VICFA|nr:unnamed protein product [Vicia faba]